MERRVYTDIAVSNLEEPSETTAPDSPCSDDIRVEAPSPKKRKTTQKKVVSVPIGEVEGSKNKGDTYPPSDSWAWRKYGQKPIKGSPYPRGYYRCSSAKGCPARKQVERSRTDPTMLIITYACDHNHPSPANKSNAATSPPSPPSSSTNSSSTGCAAVSAAESPSPRLESDEVMVFGDPPNFDVPRSESAGIFLEEEFGWFDEVASTSVLESPLCSVEDDVAWITREEDDALFADLGELPECSAVFRRSRLSLSSSVIACGGSTR